MEGTTRQAHLRHPFTSILVAALSFFLLSVSGCTADAVVDADIASGRAARPSRPPRPTRPAPPARPVRPGRPGSAPFPSIGIPLPGPTASFLIEPPTPTDPIVVPPPEEAPMAPPTDVPGEEGELRLVGRVDINGFATGALQIFHNGAFGAVCVNQFDAVDAGVACKQLGFIGGTDLPLVIRGNGILGAQQRTLIQEILAPMVLENLACTGSEERLIDCLVSMVNDYNSYDYSYTYYDSGNDCDPLQATYAFVACGTSTDAQNGDVRLSDGSTSDDGKAQFGRLEIFNGGGWGTVCDRTGEGFGPNRNSPAFTPESVNVACKQLGFSEGVLTRFARDVSGNARRIPIALGGATCTGDENSLLDCPGVAFGDNTDACSLNNIVTIVCFTGPDPVMDGNLRLMGGQAGKGFEYGRLEIFLRGFWSTICDQRTFTPDAAQVACRALGYDGGAPLEFRIPYENSSPASNQVLVANLPVGLASVDCDGSETSLLECTSSQRFLSQCGVGANATEVTVLACANTNIGCGVSAPLQEGSVRLRGGFGTPCDPIYSGFVEVFHFDEWGAICTGDDDTDRLAADVVCRQLGFPHGTLVNPLSSPPDPPLNDYGYYDYSYNSQPREEAEESQGRFWLNSVSCRGPEAKLIDCDLGQGFRSNNRGCGFRSPRFTVSCRQFPVQEALEEVTTPGAAEGDVRLVDESTFENWVLGRLEVFFEGSWSQVCALEFEGGDANVACRQLGYGAGTVGPSEANGANPSPTSSALVFPEVAVTFSGCNGTEEKLLDCGGDDDVLRTFPSRDCLSPSSPGLILACVADEINGQEGALRLVQEGPGDIDSVGILEIFHAGAWGTICDDQVSAQYDYGPSLTESSAAIACRELGFEDGLFQAVSTVFENTTLAPAWLGRLECVGFEATIMDCGELNFGGTETCGLIQRLVCSSGSGESRGEVRLVGGRGDTDGAWAYGRIEVSDGSFFVNLNERFSQRLGRRGAQVACRSLGFTTGAQILSGQFSALPGFSGIVSTVGTIACEGDEENLAECDFSNDYYSDYGQFPGDGAVALVCTTPSGCTADEAPPSQGDIRLIALDDIIETSTCDPVHFGGVEIFNNGQWGRICNGRFGGSDDSFTIDAKVICKQLGFPFGSLYDAAGARNSTGDVPGADYEDYNEPGELVWATDISCTGKEERLDECFFREAFGEAPNNNDYGASPTQGISRTSCRRQDGSVLGVVCRQFEIEESDVIRRL